jgi:thiamine transport system ATP-binding protein
VTLRLAGVTVRYGQFAALSEVDLEVADGERLTVLGPSGAGKSTLLRVVAGLESPATGSVSWNGRDLREVPVHARGFGLMFQDYVLFPHRDVAHNVAFGLRMRGDGVVAVRDRVTEVLEMVGLAGYERRAVTELSGGEQQRVALARALAPSPRLLMLDEPLGALDRALRQHLLAELRELFSRLALTILYVTHDQEEALALGDRVAVMRAGRIETVLPPVELWRAPPTEWIARFLGFSNLIEGDVDADGVVDTAWGSFSLGRAASRSVKRAGRAKLLIRPEGIRRDPAGPLSGRVTERTLHGDHTLLRVQLAAGPPLELRTDWLDPPEIGQEVRLAIDPAAVSVVD